MKNGSYTDNINQNHGYIEVEPSYNYVNACLISSDGDPGKRYYANDLHRMEEKLDKILEILGQGKRQTMQGEKHG